LVVAVNKWLFFSLNREKQRSYRQASPLRQTRRRFQPRLDHPPARRGYLLRELARDPVGSCAEVMLARRTQNSEKNAQSRTIRVHIGERLKAYYDEMQRAQPEDRLAKLMQYLSEQLVAENSGEK
jgi:hypothetical protein